MSALLGEVGLTALWFSARVLQLPAYDAAVLGMLAVRLAVTFVQAAAAFSLGQHSRSGPTLARYAFLTSAVVLTFEIGGRLTPTNVFPSHRWFVVAAYWVYAALAALAAGRVRTTIPSV